MVATVDVVLTALFPAELLMCRTREVTREGESEGDDGWTQAGRSRAAWNESGGLIGCESPFGRFANRTRRIGLLDALEFEFFRVDIIAFGFDLSV